MQVEPTVIILTISMIRTINTNNILLYTIAFRQVMNCQHNKQKYQLLYWEAYSSDNS